MKYVIGLDIGTTGCKATVFSENGHVCSKAYREYTTGEYNGMIDPDLVWEKTKEVMKECAKEYPEVDAVCTTSFGESVVLVDSKKDVLALSFLYTSSNAQEEWKTLDESVGSQKIAEITGHISHPMYTINRLMWIKKCQKDIYDKVDKFLFFASFVEMRMGARCIAEDTLAARSMAYDVKEHKWSDEILDKAGVDKEKLPQVVSAGAVIGSMSEEIQNELGFKKAAQILAGGHDQPCVALGMGAIHGGDAAYGMGTVECFTLILDEFKQTSEMQKQHLICTPHVVPGKYVTYGVLFSGGVVLQDLKNKFYAKECENCRKENTDVYHLMMDEMPQEDTPVLYLPHLAGTGTPQMNTEDTGVIYGMTLSTTRGEIVKAALEGIAFDMKQNIENMLACGLPVNGIMAAGGGAKSNKGLRVRANILERDIFVSEDVQAGTRGVFYIAAKALGWIEDYEQSCKNYEGHYITPNTLTQSFCVEKKYKRYLNLYKRTQNLDE